MRFNTHSDLAGKHAFLSASKYHWVNYEAEKIDSVFKNMMAAARGTELHEFAMNAIRLKIKLPRTRSTMNSYVNDAIGYRMTPEQVLFYSGNAFGTVDAISFRDGLLRIHDLKTGKSKASFMQLIIYAALFCLEYDVKPGTIEMELRIYQNDEVQIYIPETEEVLHVMDRIVTFDARLDQIRREVLS